MREKRKVTQNTRRQGQTRGQILARVAKQHGVSKKWLDLISTGEDLNDLGFVRAIRDAANDEQLWELVNSKVQDQLFRPTFEINSLGFSRYHLLTAIEQNIVAFQHPPNHHFASHTSAFQHVLNSIAWDLKARRDDDAELGRKDRARRAAGLETRRRNSRAPKWLSELESRVAAGESKESVYRGIAIREDLQDATIPKGIRRFLKRK